MGVSASGKTSVGRVVARALAAPFIDADDLHPQDNIEKMASGQPLSDADRMPWLARVGRELAEHSAVVVACSALKRSYRDTLRAFAPGVQFLHLDVPAEVLHDRLHRRQEHFMPASLLQSQLNDLERLEADEQSFVLDGARSPAEIIEEAQRVLGI